MADWKKQLGYNYYGFFYPQGHEQNHENFTGWGESGVVDLTSYNTGVTQAYYAATTNATSTASTARTRDESPTHSPEQHVVNGHGHYQASGVVYLGDADAGRLLLAGPHRDTYDAREKEVGRAGSDTTSDSETYTSPDSWSSGSSREGSLPQADPATWAEKDLDKETCSRSPDGSEEVSSSLLDESQTFTVIENEAINTSYMPLTSPKKPSTTAVNNTTKAKIRGRAAFSESQMNALVHRFSVQRYLTPAEMKNLAQLTGLTYKQVKTWFQNRRMKLRRHQKDTSWVSERYSVVYTDNQVHGIYSNLPPHIPPYQGEARPQLREHYNQDGWKDAAFKKTPPQNLAFYLAAMENPTGSTGYPSWSPNSTGLPNRRPVGGWSMPPGVSHYDYNPRAFSSASVTTVNNDGHNTSFESKEVEPVNSQSSLTTVIVHNPQPAVDV